jgi:hemerythrin-like metal-binding protein
MLEWKSDYETGVPMLDKQHQVLFEHINRLEMLLAQPEIEPAEAGRLLDFLENYASHHFQAEENCMERFRCPVHAKNMKEHAQFLNVLKFCRGEYASTTEPREILERLHATVVWWIHNHILQVDIQLKRHTGYPSNGG